MTTALEAMVEERAQELAEDRFLLSKLKAEGRITPAQERLFWSKLDIHAKRAFARTAPKVAGTDPTHIENQEPSDYY